MDKLVEKCLLTDKEIDKAWPDEVVYVGNLESEVMRCSRLVAQAQLLKAIPIISSEIKKELEGMFKESGYVVTEDWQDYWKKFQSPSGVEEK